MRIISDSRPNSYLKGMPAGTPQVHTPRIQTIVRRGIIQAGVASLYVDRDRRLPGVLFVPACEMISGIGGTTGAPLCRRMVTTKQTKIPMRPAR